MYAVCKTSEIPKPQAGRLSTKCPPKSISKERLPGFLNLFGLSVLSRKRDASVKVR